MIKYTEMHYSQKSLSCIKEAVKQSSISGDNSFTDKCCNFFKKKYHFKNVFLTPSCTHAIEMTALLLNIKEDDEIIMPSYTFVSSANPFILRGGRIIFCDSSFKSPNINPNEIEALITKKTRALLIVHYAGINCDMSEILTIVRRYKIALIEDCAQAIDSYYKKKPLGSFGDFATFSFHDSKNISCGEGGLLIVNNEKYLKRAEIIREKGTNRSSFFRGEIKKYNWIDIGSSYLASDITAAYLFGQLQSLTKIQAKRMKLFERYYFNLQKLKNYQKHFTLPDISLKNKNYNGHIFFIVLNKNSIRKKLIAYLNKNGIQAVSHYISLHNSPFYKKYHDGRKLNNSNIYTNQLLRLPLHMKLNLKEVDFISKKIINFFIE